jgi:hypothetical protein
MDNTQQQAESKGTKSRTEQPDSTQQHSKAETEQSYTQNKGGWPQQTAGKG